MQRLLVHGTSIQGGVGWGSCLGSKRIRECGREVMQGFEGDRRPISETVKLKEYKVECQRPMFWFYRVQCQTNAFNIRISPWGKLSVGEELLETTTQLIESLFHLIS